MVKKKKNYWTIDCENAVVDYLNGVEDADKIFEEILYPKLRHMIENIMFKYHLFDSSQEIDEQINDTLSFVIMKFRKFDPSKGCKAYSYFGTVAKHYMMMKKQKKSSNSSNVVSVDEIIGYEFENDLCEDNLVEKDMTSLSYFIHFMSDELYDHFMDNIGDYPKNVYKVMDSVEYMMKNYQQINIYSKNHFYFLCRERTGLKTKEITKALNIIKDVYHKKKENLI
jgi:hypothetical protein